MRFFFLEEHSEKRTEYIKTEAGMEMLQSFKWVITVIRMYTHPVGNGDKRSGQIQEIVWKLNYQSWMTG